MPEEVSAWKARDFAKGRWVMSRGSCQRREELVVGNMGTIMCCLEKSVRRRKRNH